jgi:hypothetical protein
MPTIEKFANLQTDKKWDVFIAHASEDKDSFVRPLAVSLNRLGVDVWYDEFSLRLGDNLSRSIDHGLAKSRFGIVVISPNFIGKAWPARELGGLVSREIDQGRVIIPIWHGVTRNQVLDFSPTLADKLPLRTEDYTTAEDVSIQVLREIRPDLYEKHPRSELERLASGEALKDLQRELDRAKETLTEYQCPYCGSPLAERLGAPADPNGEHTGLREIFECGFQSFDGFIERPCPSDPKFPRFADYELKFHHNVSETHYPWFCLAFPKTDMARRLSLLTSYGRTKDEAEQQLRREYERHAAKYNA